MLIRDIAPKPEILGPDSEVRVMSREDARDMFLKRIRNELCFIEKSLKRQENVDNPTPVETRFAELYELLDGLMGNDLIAPDKVYQKQRNVREACGGYRGRLALCPKT